MMMEFNPRVAFDAPFCFQIRPLRDYPKPSVTTDGSGSSAALVRDLIPIVEPINFARISPTDPIDPWAWKIPQLLCTTVGA
jgi:hypothetical protein